MEHYDEYEEAECSELDADDVQVQFEEKLLKAADTERHYLLTAFASMANSRNVGEDPDFVVKASVDIFRAGFAVADLEGLEKGSRDLLVDIAAKHPYILSVILRQFEDEEVLSVCGNRSFYVIAELPFELWKPDDEDFQMILEWLRESLESPHSKLSRIVLSNLDWNSIGFRYHLDAALAIVDSSAENLTQNADLMHQVVSAIRQQTPEQLFTTWAWETVTKLRLHSADRDSVCAASIRGESGAFEGLLDFDLDPRAENLVKGVMSKNPLCLYIALQCTPLGHSLPEICSAGFAHLKALSQSGRFDHVMEVIINLSALFLPCPETAAECEDFIGSVQAVVSADQTVYKMAKDLIISDFPGPVMIEFGNLLVKQLDSFHKFGFEDSGPALKFWLKVLTSIPNWFKDRNCLFAVDILCREAFYSTKGQGQIVKERFSVLHHELLNKSGEKSFGSWFSSGGKYVNAVSYLPSSSEFAFFAYFMLEVEDETELNAKLWPDLVEELKNSDSDVETALKNLKLGKLDSNFLPVYRWSKQFLDTNDGHPMLWVFAQRFFFYFLARPLPDNL